MDGERTEGWDYVVPLYRVLLRGVPPGTGCLVGCNRHAPGDREVYSARLTLSKPLAPREARRLLSQVYRAVLGRAERDGAWAAANALGGQDAPGSLPAGMPPPGDVWCFWMLHFEHPRPVLAFRTNFKDKDRLKALFDEVWKASDGAEYVVNTGWRKDARVWWCRAEHAYPALLGRMRQVGWRLKWVQREGFPPAPPVERLPPLSEPREEKPRGW